MILLTAAILAILSIAVAVTLLIKYRKSLYINNLEENTMAQYSSYTVDVTKGSATVTGALGTQFLTYVVPGNSFKVAGSPVVYTVASVISDTELMLSAPYQGVTAYGLGYQITRDYTPNFGFAEIAIGDQDWPIHLTQETIRKIDSTLAAFFIYKGGWNAAANFPVIPAAAPSNAGFLYKVTTAGNTIINGISGWEVGDSLMSNGTVWTRVAGGVSSTGGSDTEIVTITDIDSAGATWQNPYIFTGENGIRNLIVDPTPYCITNDASAPDIYIELASDIAVGYYEIATKLDPNVYVKFPETLNYTEAGASLDPLNDGSGRWPYARGMSYKSWSYGPAKFEIRVANIANDLQFMLCSDWQNSGNTSFEGGSTTEEGRLERYTLSKQQFLDASTNVGRTTTLDTATNYTVLHGYADANANTIVLYNQTIVLLDSFSAADGSKSVTIEGSVVPGLRNRFVNTLAQPQLYLLPLGHQIIGKVATDTADYSLANGYGHNTTTGIYYIKDQGAILGDTIELQYVDAGYWIIQYFSFESYMVGAIPWSKLDTTAPSLPNGFTVGATTLSAAELATLDGITTGASIQAQLDAKSPITPKVQNVTTATDTIAADIEVVNCNYNGATTTLTLPDPTTCKGRAICIYATYASTINSASANVVPLSGASAAALIITALAGYLAVIRSNGTNWRVVSNNTANYLSSVTSDIQTQLNGKYSRVPTTYTITTAATYVVLADNIVCGYDGINTITLPAASSNVGREITIKALYTGEVKSTNSDVVGSQGGAATNTIMEGVAGYWVVVRSDGTFWRVINNADRLKGGYTTDGTKVERYTLSESQYNNINSEIGMVTTVSSLVPVLTVSGVSTSTDAGVAGLPLMNQTIILQADFTSTSNYVLIANDFAPGARVRIVNGLGWTHSQFIKMTYGAAGISDAKQVWDYNEVGVCYNMSDYTTYIRTPFLGGDTVELQFIGGTTWRAMFFDFVSYISGSISWDAIDLAGAATKAFATAEQTINADSTTPALKITQTGTGHALHIEDEASDTTPVIVTKDGDVLIGSSTGTDKLSVTGTVSATQTGFSKVAMSSPALGQTRVKATAPSGTTNSLDLDVENFTGGIFTYINMFKANTVSSGGSKFNIYKGDGTASINTSLSSSGTSYINALGGDLLVGTATAPGQGRIQIAQDTGCGIFLGNTDNPSTVALDWYEESTSNACSLGGTTVWGTAILTTSSRHYTRIGRTITISIRLIWTALSGSTGNIMISGLPVACAATHGQALSVYYTGLTVGAGKQLVALTSPGSTYVTLHAADPSGGAVTGVPVDQTGELVITGTYTV